MSTLGNAKACFSTASSISANFFGESLTPIKITWESTPCSAWDNKSEATKSASASSSAMTSTSDGPAGISMEHKAVVSF
ncbi:hypothetical protein WICPIJ_005984 [Wickerhamomyces pijperi]|uniref:Uncharacterized protein n=1 Tax=Wickerhamomyces pijperi TaxID=599730 RepID=A0A9P8Q2Z0_WICPI|nr:hypothetical protein WICPIJ_005984 [Wickerhamomyces pijperi]